MSGVGDACESECDERMSDAEAWEPSDPAFWGVTQKVWSISTSLTRVTYLVVDISQTTHTGEKEETTWRYSSCWCPVPDHI